MIIVISQFWQICMLMEPKLGLDNKEEQKQVSVLSDKCLYPLFPPKKIPSLLTIFVIFEQQNNVQQVLINSLTSQTKVYDLGIEKSHICQFHL